jgi:hypothetical protein
MFDTPFIIPVVAIACWAVVSVVRAKHGYHPYWGDRHNAQVPPMFDKLLEKAMQERDSEIKSLRERIEVLEKIVTDSHSSTSLADEIEKLRTTR